VFIRKKRNDRGVISIQILRKSLGKNKLIETVGSSSDPQQVEQLCRQAKGRISELGQQSSLNFDVEERAGTVGNVFTGLDEIRLTGPELLLGELFDEIGFKAINFKLFRSLVITRLIYLVSKLKTTDFWLNTTGRSSM